MFDVGDDVCRLGQHRLEAGTGDVEDQTAAFVPQLAYIVAHLFQQAGGFLFQTPFGQGNPQFSHRITSRISSPAISSRRMPFCRA